MVTFLTQEEGPGYWMDSTGESEQSDEKVNIPCPWQQPENNYQAQIEETHV